MYLEKFQLDGRVAVITGGGQGIGLACAQALDEAGAAVILTDISEERCASGQATLKKHRLDVETRVLDVTDSDSIEAAAQDLAEGGRDTDILVCNAGIAQAGVPVETMTDADWLRMIDINLNGVFRCCRSFVNRMLEKGKAAVHHLARSMAAVEWAIRGVRVNAVASTYIDMPLLEFAREDTALFNEWLDQPPMHRVGTTAEIASVVLFLASDASSLLTGSIVAAYAGYTCW